MRDEPENKAAPEPRAPGDRGSSGPKGDHRRAERSDPKPAEAPARSTKAEGDR